MDTKFLIDSNYTLNSYIDGQGREVSKYIYDNGVELLLIGDSEKQNADVYCNYLLEPVPGQPNTYKPNYSVKNPNWKSLM
ncbi:hypothetical protein B4W74_04650 [Staphylococcus intermedius]|uniref:hypothetical protein n=1 Tax=Staphylococcus intermedius TaxID=1285 RepID=UPI000BBC4D4B|nr:hypothetical protein [Staphylococcus intermedius]PCF80957.1 hypothetical protein B4W74_04650 [Staphylococcus intermedius]PCF85996.1 hypothetical protein B4W75_11545 [Staphylococcus intermedius]